MSLLLAMWPVYLVGNLHCAGMCGPLVMLIGRHPYRHYYFLGRTSSFALAGFFAGLFGQLIQVQLERFHLGALVSLLFGGIILLTGIMQIWRIPLPIGWLQRSLGSLSRSLAMLPLQATRGAIFLFGFCTILLPCGQTIMVYSACALSGSAAEGLLNGFAFALLTAPSLVMAMHTASWLGHLRRYYHVTVGVLALLVGVLAILRGLAEFGVIPHLVLWERMHVVLY